MRKTVDFTEHEIAAIEAKGREAYHMSFSACLKYCLKDLFQGGGEQPKQSFVALERGAGSDRAPAVSDSRGGSV